MIKLTKILKFEHQILATLLLVYHGLIWSELQPQQNIALLLVLYGLFLLWQPLWNKDSKIRKLPLITIGISFILVSYYFPSESLVFFGLVLSGLIGSRLLSRTSRHSFDLAALIIIILEIVIGVVPATFEQVELPPQFTTYMQPVILVPILLLYLAPNQDYSDQERNRIDLMHGLLASTLVFIVLLGGIVINLLYGVDYIDGLLLTVFIVATLTIGISWFWNPGVGYSGIRVLLNRYTMTIGTPFETWINTLTSLIEEHYLTPAEYLDAACEHLVENEWLNGIQWKFRSYQISSGEKKGIKVEHVLNPKASVEVYFKSNPGTALEHHTLLLIRMAYQFYLSKLNQEKIRTTEHFATIHHTGARLTHDMKNILQSIRTSLDILNLDKTSKRQQELLQLNLNQISTRLENTLSRLKAPDMDTQIKLLNCELWMDKLAAAHQSNPRILIQREIESNINLPVDLFDNVVENLVNNALRKASARQIEVILRSSGGTISLSVCDDGIAVEESIEENLFRQPASSGSGMGIGLYQAAIMAHTFGFELKLDQNESGRVCFSLSQHQGANKSA
ncbi:MAG: sensor histidine kinase [Gammaproteobacteria bacterium]